MLQFYIFSSILFSSILAKRYSKEIKIIVGDHFHKIIKERKNLMMAYGTDEIEDKE